VPGSDQAALGLNHTPHHDWVFETVFSSGDDETIANAVCAWIASGCHPLPGSCMEDFIEHMGGETPLSARLRRMSIRAIERIWRGDEAPGLDVVRLVDGLTSRETLNVDFWEELEGRMAGVWPRSASQPEPVEHVGRVTLRLLLQRPSALPRFERISEMLQMEQQKVELRRICELARTEQPPEPLPP